MHRLTGTDSTQPTVNMCRQDRISALAAGRCIYLPLSQTHNSTELQLPRLRGADNTCKRHHSQPLPARVYSFAFHTVCLNCTSLNRVCNNTVEWLSSEWRTGVLVCVLNVFDHVHSHVPRCPTKSWRNTKNRRSLAFCRLNSSDHSYIVYDGFTPGSSQCVMKEHASAILVMSCFTFDLWSIILVNKLQANTVSK